MSICGTLRCKQATQHIQRSLAMPRNPVRLSATPAAYRLPPLPPTG